MSKIGEYKGGFYVIIEFVGLYVRYFIFQILQKGKSINYLSGEEELPKINKKQRFYCLIVGIALILFFISLLVVFGCVSDQ